MTKAYKLTKDKFLADSELADLLRLIATNPSRDACLIRLALATGGRASELLAITQADVDVSACTVYIRGLKGSNDRLVPITRKLADDLSALLTRSGSTGVAAHAGASRPPGPSADRLFAIGYQRLVQVWNHYRPVKKKFHSLRHTFAISLYKRTRNLKLVQQMLGHKNINNTMVYLDFCYDIDEVRRQVLGDEQIASKLKSS